MVEALGSISDDLAAFEKGFLKSVTALLVLLSCLMVSQWQKLGLELDMLVSLGRGFLQLTVVGFVLNFIFNQTGLSGIAWMFGAFCMMVTNNPPFYFHPWDCGMKQWSPLHRSQWPASQLVGVLRAFHMAPSSLASLSSLAAASP